jgi:hypothetical protein
LIDIHYNKAAASFKNKNPLNQLCLHLKYKCRIQLLYKSNKIIIFSVAVEKLENLYLPLALFLFKKELNRSKVP